MKIRFIPFLAGLAILASTSPTFARSFRPGMIPNGNVKGCANCHVNPSGGGTRTPFGNDVFAIVKGSSATPFWGPDLAKKDSDGDGFTNGQELGDPEGTGTPFSGAQVTNPGQASNKPVEKPPVVTITSPSSGLATPPPWSGTVQAETSFDAAAIVKVEIWDGANLLGAVTSPPFDIPVTINSPGDHSIVAKATDYLGFIGTSVPIVLTLSAPANVPPVVQLTSPADGSVFAAPDTVTLTASASDPDGSVAMVEFLEGTNVLAMVMTSPFSLVVSNLTSGAHQFTARATDNMGAVTISAPIGIQMNVPPPGAHVVLIQGFKFIPASLTINPGETVTWVQKDTVQHTTTSDAATPIWDSGLLSLNQMYSFTFNTPGTFAYHCTPHPVNMRAVITVSAPSNPPPAVVITNIVNDGQAVTISWQGGAGPFLLQRKTSLDETNWFNLMTTRSLYVTVPKEGGSGFYRVMDQTTNVVIPLSVLLSGSSDAPSTTITATGSGSLSLEGLNLSYHISFSGLSGDITGAHIHGSADAGHTAGVIIPFNVGTGSSGVLAGNATLTAAQLADLFAGSNYVNIHTDLNPGGEIRGQIVPLRIPVNLSGAAEVPPVTASATGSGWITLVGNQMFYDIDFFSLSGDAAAAHLHGPADASHSSGVYFALDGASGTSGTLEGQHALNVDQLTNLLAGMTYVNIHTPANGAGEVRGQVAPWQFAVTLNGAADGVTTTGSGSGTLSLAGNVLTYSIQYGSLTSEAVAAHIHGPADASQSAGVLFPLNGVSGTSGTLSGTQVLTADQIADLVLGKTYVNIHTTNFGGGEIRGQVMLRY